MDNISKPIILTYEDFKTKVADITNQYLEELPAIFIADFYDKMASTVREIANQQLLAAKQQESEVKENGKREGTC